MSDINELTRKLSIILEDEGGPGGYKNPGVVDYAKEHGRRLFNSAKEEGSAAVRGMKEEAKEFHGNLKEMYKENAPKAAKAYDSAKDALYHAGKGMKEEAKEFGGNLKEMAKETSHKAAPIVHAAKKAVSGAAEDAKAMVRGTGERYKEAGLSGIAKDYINSADKTFTPHIDKGIKTAKEGFEKAKEIAKDVAFGEKGRTEDRLAELQRAAHATPKVDMDKVGVLTKGHAAVKQFLSDHPDAPKYAGIGVGALAAGVGGLKALDHFRKKNKQG